jgi:hypothetical protein
MVEDAPIRKGATMVDLLFGACPSNKHRLMGSFV